MFQILIIDDEKKDIMSLTNLIRTFAMRNNANFTIYDSSSATSFEEVIHKSKGDPVVVFADIQLETMNGIDLMNTLKAQYNPVIYKLIFTSNFPELVFDSFRAHPDGFLKKPVAYKELESTLNDVLKSIKLEQQNDKIILLKDFNTGDQRAMLESQIIAILVKSAAKRELQVYTPYGDFDVYGYLNDIIKKLDQTRFYSSHRSAIINLSWIKTIKKDEVLMNSNPNLTVPLSKSKRKTLLLHYDDFIIKGM